MKLRRAKAHFAVALLIGWAGVQPGAAFGQKLGSILPDYTARMSTRNILEADRARATMNAYAQCLVKMRAVKVQRALAPQTDDEADAALSKLAVPDCLEEGMLRMPGNLMRGAVYRALYIRDIRANSAATLVPARTTSAAHDDHPLRTFGRCVLSINTADARAFILSDPATPAEKTAVQGLAPALSQCVAPGQQIHFSRSTLQGLLAEVAYRQAMPPFLVNK